MGGGLYINTDPQQRGANSKIGSRAQGIGGQSKIVKNIQNPYSFLNVFKFPSFPYLQLSPLSVIHLDRPSISPTMIFLTHLDSVPLLLIHPSSYTFFFIFPITHSILFRVSSLAPSSCNHLQPNPSPYQSPFHAHSRPFLFLITLFVASYIPPHFPDSSGYPLFKFRKRKFIKSL